MDTQSNQATELFTLAFGESLAEILSQETKSSWTIEPVDKPNLATRQGSPFHVRMSADGSLRGDCFIEFYRSEVATLSAKLIGKPGTPFDDDHADAIVKAITSSVTGLVASLSPEYGLLTITVDGANGIAPGAMRIVPLVASCGESEPISILMYFTTQLVEALSPQKPAPNPIVEKVAPAAADQPNLRLVMDVELNVTLRFGQRHLPLREVLALESGSVVELDHQVDEPIELLLDGKVIARGEAVIVDGNYGLRVTEVPQPVISRLIH